MRRCVSYFVFVFNLVIRSDSSGETLCLRIPGLVPGVRALPKPTIEKQYLSVFIAFNLLIEIAFCEIAIA